MKNEQFDIEEKLLRYLEEEMSSEELKSFEAVLQKDAALRTELDAMRLSLLMAEGAEQDALEAKFKAWNLELGKNQTQSPPPKRFSIWPFLLLIPIAVGAYFLLKNKNPEENTIQPAQEIPEQKKNVAPKEDTAPIEKTKEPKPQIETKSKSPTKPKPTQPNRPIAALLSSEQRNLLSDKILIIDGIRSPGIDKAALYPMWAILEKARALLLDNKPEDARTILQNIPDDDIYYPKALELVGHAELTLGNCPAALNALEKSLSISQDPQTEYTLYLTMQSCAVTSEQTAFLKAKIVGDKEHPYRERVE